MFENCLYFLYCGVLHDEDNNKTVKFPQSLMIITYGDGYVFMLLNSIYIPWNKTPSVLSPQSVQPSPEQTFSGPNLTAESGCRTYCSTAALQSLVTQLTMLEMTHLGCAGPLAPLMIFDNPPRAPTYCLFRSRSYFQISAIFDTARRHGRRRGRRGPLHPQNLPRAAAPQAGVRRAQ